MRTGKVTKHDVIVSIITAVVALVALWAGIKEPQNLIYLFIGGYIYRCVHCVIPPEKEKKK